MKKFLFVAFVLSMFCTTLLLAQDSTGTGDGTTEEYPAYYTWLSGAINVLLGVIMAFREKSSATARKFQKLMDNIITQYERGNISPQSIGTIVEDAKALKKGEPTKTI